MLVALERGGSGPPSYYLRYAFGSCDDPPGASGLAHLVEHLSFRSGGGLRRLLARLGGLANATTALDWTAFYAVLPLGGLEQALATEATRAETPLISSADIAQEARVIRAEREARRAEDEFALEEQVRACVFGDQPYGRSCLGDDTSLKDLDPAAAAAFQSQFYRLDRAVLAVAGDIDTDAVQRHVHGLFATGSPSQPTLGALPPRFEGGSHRWRDEGVAIVSHGPGASDPEWESFALAGNVFAERAATARGEWTFSLFSYARVGLAVCRVGGLSPREVIAEANRIGRRRPDHHELLRARGIERLGDARQLEDAGERAELVAHAVAAGRSPESVLRRWDATTSDEVDQAWRRILSGASALLAPASA